MLGQTISNRVLEERWAYAELSSSRFSHTYRALVFGELFVSAGNGVPFEDLTESDRRTLSAAIEAHPGRRGLLPAIWEHPTFTCRPLSRDDLLRTLCVPGLDWDPLAKLASMQGPFADSHPRSALAKIPTSLSFVQAEPGIVLPDFDDGEHRAPLLLEGTLRALWFLRQNEPETAFLAWLPSTAQMAA